MKVTPHRRPGVLARRWRPLALTAVLLVLSGAVVLVWLRIDQADRRAADLATEADRRGTAVSTLAGDVRVLRAQITAKGETPAAPDPARAVEDLPGRAKVPVPIPGPPGPAGETGEQGAPGRPGRDAPAPSPGPAGPPGESVTGPPGETIVGPAGPAGPPGPAGPAGEAGKNGTDGKDGKNGADGQTCPDGYTLQPPPGDPDALVCRRSSAPGPSPDPPPGGTTSAALPAERRRS